MVNWLYILVVCWLGFWLLTSCEEDEWMSFVYPNKTDLTTYRNVGAYQTLESCRAAAWALIDAGGWQETADYECGLNCKPGAVILLCDKTER
jgi:hypothetical protein